MRSVKIAKAELLQIVTENQAKHIAEYEEAVQDFVVLALKIAKENVKLANTGNLDQIAKIKPIPAAPVSYVSDYARAARMLQLSVDDVIELEDDVFNQLVLDEWSWKRSFVVSNTMYKTLGH